MSFRSTIRTDSTCWWLAGSMFLLLIMSITGCGGGSDTTVLQPLPQDQQEPDATAQDSFGESEFE